MTPACSSLKSQPAAELSPHGPAAATPPTSPANRVNVALTPPSSPRSPHDNDAPPLISNASPTPTPSYPSSPFREPAPSPSAASSSRPASSPTNHKREPTPVDADANSEPPPSPPPPLSAPPTPRPRKRATIGPRVYIEGDGACLPRSLAAIHFGVPDGGTVPDALALEMRETIVQNLPWALENSILKELVYISNESGTEVEVDSMDEYAAAMRLPGTWGGNLELTAATKATKRSFIVLADVFGRWNMFHRVVFRAEDPNATWHVLFHDFNHWTPDPSTVRIRKWAHRLPLWVLDPDDDRIHGTFVGPGEQAVDLKPSAKGKG